MNNTHTGFEDEIGAYVEAAVNLLHPDQILINDWAPDGYIVYDKIYESDLITHIDNLAKLMETGIHLTNGDVLDIIEYEIPPGFHEATIAFQKHEGIKFVHTSFHCILHTDSGTIEISDDEGKSKIKISSKLLRFCCTYFNL